MFCIIKSLFACKMFLNLAVHFQGNFWKYWSHWQNIKIKAESSWRHLRPCLVQFYLHKRTQLNRNWTSEDGLWGSERDLIYFNWMLVDFTGFLISLLFSIWEPNWRGTPRLQERHRTAPIPLWVKSLNKTPVITLSLSSQAKIFYPLFSH